MVKNTDNRFIDEFIYKGTPFCRSSTHLLLIKCSTYSLWHALIPERPLFITISISIPQFQLRPLFIMHPERPLFITISISIPQFQLRPLFIMHPERPLFITYIAKPI